MERFAEKIVQKCIKSKTSLLFQARRVGKPSFPEPYRVVCELSRLAVPAEALSGCAFGRARLYDAAIRCAPFRSAS